MWSKGDSHLKDDCHLVVTSAEILAAKRANPQAHASWSAWEEEEIDQWVAAPKFWRKLK